MARWFLEALFPLLLFFSLAGGGLLRLLLGDDGVLGNIGACLFVPAFLLTLIGIFSGIGFFGMVGRTGELLRFLLARKRPACGSCEGTGRAPAERRSGFAKVFAWIVVAVVLLGVALVFLIDRGLIPV